jgi:hypothetical protein
MMKSGGTGFLSGASAGFFGSLGASAWGKVVGDSTVGMIAFGAHSGGVGAELTGGNFWQGAVTGLIVSGLNHAMHQMAGEDGIDPPKKGELRKIELRNSDGLTQDQYDNLSTFDKMFSSPPGMMASSGGLELIGGPAKGIKYLGKMAKNPNFVSSAAKKIGDFWEYSVKLSGSKGSFTVYKRYLNAEGRTVKMFHDTYNSSYKFLHREIMNGQERMKIFYDGTRQWFSKWR